VDYKVSKEEYTQRGGVREDGERLRVHEGKFRGKDCMFELYITKRAIRGTGTREAHWTLGITKLVHSYNGLANPFNYPEHEKIHPRSLEIHEEASRHIRSGVKYGLHKEITAESTVPMSRKRYNNLGLIARHEVTTPASVIDRLLVLLEEKKFFVRVD
jgi:hypothetical protein